MDEPRGRLTSERVLDAAMELADEIGIEAFTIRKLAARLGVGPMTIYHHVPGKDEIIDGIVDRVFEEIGLPSPDGEWRVAMRDRCLSARRVLNRHPWAAPLMESRTMPGPANLRHHDAVIGCLRRGGLSIEMTAHAYAILDAYVYGYALEEAHLPTGDAGDLDEAAEAMAGMFTAYPHLLELTTEHVMKPGYDFGASFEVGLDMLLDGIDRTAREDG